MKKLIIAASLLTSCNYVHTVLSERENNAQSYARSLGIDPLAINCDESFGACGCAIRYHDGVQERVIGAVCCGYGCEPR